MPEKRRLVLDALAGALACILDPAAGEGRQILQRCGGAESESRSDGALRRHPIRQGVETLGESGVAVAGGIVDIIRAVDAAVADILELAALCRIDRIVDLDEAGKSG